MAVYSKSSAIFSLDRLHDSLEGLTWAWSFTAELLWLSIARQTTAGQVLILQLIRCPPCTDTENWRYFLRKGGNDVAVKGLCGRT